MPDAGAGLERKTRECPLPKAEGAVVASAAGDALGWPQEMPRKTVGATRDLPPSSDFRTWKRRDGWRRTAHIETIRRGEYSDDTQLTLAVARSLLSGPDGWYRSLTRTELPLWTVCQRGGGGATKRAAKSWVGGIPPWEDRRICKRYFSAGGNGVAMRIIPHAIYHAGVSDARRLLCDVVLDGIATHGHPRALIGATALAIAAWWMLRMTRTVRFGELLEFLQDTPDLWGASQATEACEARWRDAAHQMSDGSYTSLWTRTRDELIALLRQAQQGIRQGAIADDSRVLREMGCFGKQKGSGTISAAAAVYLCARHAARPEAGVLTAAFAHGADTDTLAAMTGGLLGSLVGLRAIPSSWQAVQDCSYMRNLAASVIRSSVGQFEALAEPLIVGAKHIRKLRTTLASDLPEVFEFDGVRKVRIAESGRLEARSKGVSVRVLALETSDGQRLFVKRTRFGPAASSQPDLQPASHGNSGRHFSPNSEAILLLTARLADRHGTLHVDLLSAREYGALAKRLNQLSRQPCDLLRADSKPLIEQCRRQVEPSRIRALLTRRPALDTAISRWRENGIWVLTRADQAYPKHLRKRLGPKMPPVLYGQGDSAVMNRSGLVVLGSDSAGDTPSEYARKAGALAGESGLLLLSPGLTEPDRSAIRGALQAGGRCLTIMGHNTANCSPDTTGRQLRRAASCASVCLNDPTLESATASLARDCEFLFANGSLALVVEASVNREYPLQCVRDLLHRWDWGCVFVRTGRNCSEGLQLLRELGARPWPNPPAGPELAELAQGVANVPTRPQATEGDDGEALTHSGKLAEELLKSVAELLPKLRGQPMSTAQIADKLGVNHWLAERWIHRLVGLGFLAKHSPENLYSIHDSTVNSAKELDPQNIIPNASQASLPFDQLKSEQTPNRADARGDVGIIRQELPEVSANQNRLNSEIQQKFRDRSMHLEREIRKMREPLQAFAMRVSSLPLSRQIRFNKVYQVRDLEWKVRSVTYSERGLERNLEGFDSGNRWKWIRNGTRSDFNNEAVRDLASNVYCELHCDGFNEIGIVACNGLKAPTGRLFSTDILLVAVANLICWRDRINRRAGQSSAEYSLEVELLFKSRYIPIVGSTSAEIAAQWNQQHFLPENTQIKLKYLFSSSMEFQRLMRSFHEDLFSRIGIDLSDEIGSYSIGL